MISFLPDLGADLDSSPKTSKIHGNLPTIATPLPNLCLDWCFTLAESGYIRSKWCEEEKGVGKSPFLNVINPLLDVSCLILEH